ncbi:MAG: carbohydrate ABC transporter permease [Lachnospiraceae bacterium]|nr:carbohydrate ABC transporter permease [Lachnospiraceae bacterium]
MEKKEKGLSVGTRRTIAYVVLAIISFLCLFWFYMLLINSTRSHAELGRGFRLIPGGYMIANLKGMLNGTQPILNGLLNSVIVATCTAALSVYFSTLTAFAIHAYDFKLKKPLFTFILAIMMIPTQVTALGFIQLIRKMNLMNSFIPLIIPAIAAPITFFYLKQYMETALPHELLEAARIDGASEITIFNKIALPIMVPGIAVQLIFTFVSSWNNYFTPALVLVDNDKKKTLPILIAMLRAADFLKFDMGIVYMTIAFSIFPVVVVYLLLSKYIVGGVAVGAVKG